MDTQKLQACVQKQDDTAVKASEAEGTKLGVDSTPTLFVNGQKLMGVMTEEQMRLVLDRALADAGQKPPTNAANK